jgi:hypothetical protein
MDAPLDTWHALVGVAVASVVVFGAAASLPTRPPPDAAGVADTVDRVAVADATATATHPLAAEELRLEADRVALRNDAGTARARFAFGPVVPVFGTEDAGTATGTAPDSSFGTTDRDAAGARLGDVLHGGQPADVYDSPAAFRTAVASASGGNATWQPAPDALTVRHVTWEGIDVTLVGAAR